MPLIPYPAVPASPGVPAVPRSPSAPAPVAASLGGIIAGALWRALQVNDKWGITDATGRPLADPRKLSGLAGTLLESVGGVGVLGAGLYQATMSTDGMDYSKETKVSDFPVEAGGFASYNKVEMPANPNVTLCLSGSETDRKAFLNALDVATKSTDLFNVVTPEVTYIGYSLERYSYQRRTARGATLLIVELSLKEVRQITSTLTKSAITSPAASSAKPPVDGGKVQLQAPKVSTLKSLVSKGFAALTGQ